MDRETARLWRRTLIVFVLVVMVAGIVFIIASENDSAERGSPGDDVSDVDESGPADDDELLVTVFDVGQAQAVAIVSPTGEAMLVDASRSQQRIEEYIVPYLADQGVDHLDYLVTSHPDQDHIGGMPKVLELLDVETYVDPVIPSTNQTYAETLELVIELQVDALEARRGMELELGPEASASILWPDEPLLESGGEPDSNENSIVLRVEYGEVSILIPGDAGNEAEEHLIDLDSGQHLESDVLVVGHHGSNTSTSGLFLDAVSPDVAIISAGFDNPYGHPTDEVIQRLRLRGIEIYRTDLDGTIEIRSNGNEYTVEMLGTEATP